MVAASISAASKIDVATSALRSRQYFSRCPGTSNKSACRPQEEHCDAETAGALPFGPNNIELPPLNRSLELQHPQEPILGKSIQEKLSVPLRIRKGEMGLRSRGIAWPAERPASPGGRGRAAVARRFRLCGLTGLKKKGPVRRRPSP